MKYLVVLFTVLFTLLGTASAVEDVITLDDVTPSIDAVISLPTGATGSVHVEMAGAALTLLDSQNEPVLQVSDERVHSVQFNLIPNSGDHTLHLERLDSVDIAAVSITSLSEFLLQPASQEIYSNAISVDQSSDIVLNSGTPNAVIDISIPNDQLGLFASTTPNISTMNQLVDDTGTVVATTMNGHVDGISILIDGGNYQYTMVGTNLTDTVNGNVRVSPYDYMENPILFAEQREPLAVAPAVNSSLASNAQAASTAGCNASVFVSSVNLRSGPGTGYSVIDYGFQNEVFPVGGTNPQTNWIVVGLDSGNSAWMTRSAANLDGNCTDLAVFNIPYREAQLAEVVVVQAEPQQPIIIGQSAYAGEYEDDDYYEEYEDDDHDYEEYEDDDHHEEYEEHEHEEHEDDDD